jgi:choline dehydrogenase
MKITRPYICLLAAASYVNSLPAINTDKHLTGSSFGVPGRNATYDYVVIGGGTAGLTVAARLAETNTVAVIEAGSFYEINNGNISQIPSDDAYFTGKDPDDTNPLIDWSFLTTPQKVRVFLYMKLELNRLDGTIFGS